MSADRKYGDQPSRPIYVWNGILEPKHRKRIGQAIWLFLYFIDRTTKERPNKNNPEEIQGWVYGKMPLTLERMAEETGIPQRTISRYLVTLEGHDYIQTVRTPHGLIILVQKSSKWPNGKRNAKSGESPHAKSGESPAIYGDSSAKSGECRKDKAVDLSRDERIRGENTAQSAVALPPSNSNSNSERQPQEKSNPNPETLLTGKTETPRPYTEAAIREALRFGTNLKRVPRTGMSNSEVDERRRFLAKQAEELAGKYPSNGKAAIA